MQVDCQLEKELTEGKKKCLQLASIITLCDVPACSQKLPWTSLWLYLDQRSPRATGMSEQMGLINHLVVSFPHAVQYARNGLMLNKTGFCAW